MAEKTFIIHPSIIQKDLLRSNLPDLDRLNAEVALTVIQSTLASATNLVVADDLPLQGNMFRLETPAMNGDVYLLRQSDPGVVQDCVQPGDKVKLMGAFTGICLGWADDAARDGGVTDVTISPLGAYDRPPIHRKAK